jgi:Family of unknown function (DUF6210)
MRRVFVNPSAFLMHPWMAVLVPAQTGVVYEHQTGGVACLPRRIESYYVPVFDQGALDLLRSIFEVALGGSGTYAGVTWAGQILEDLRIAVARVRMDSSEGGPVEAHLSLDESRLGETDEAWVLVTTPDGPAVLIWENSD